MATLMTIPLEIRELILQYVLQAQREPPSAPTSKRWTLDHQHYWDIIRVEPFHSRHLPMPIVLQLTSRQLAVETRSAIRRFPDRNANFALDIMFVNENEVWPTWTRCDPCLETPHARRVDVQIRAFGGCGEKRSGLTPGCGGPPPFVWNFFCLLENFLKCGPDGYGFEHDSARQWCVMHLDIDIPEEGDMHLLPDQGVTWENWLWRARGWGGHEKLRNTVIRPEWLAHELAVHMRILLRASGQTQPYAELIYKSVGSIVIRAKGSVVENFDLAKLLKEIYGEPYFKSDPDSWRGDIQTQRKERGLPVLE